jgi:hypothetical protein
MSAGQPDGRAEAAILHHPNIDEVSVARDR